MNKETQDVIEQMHSTQWSIKNAEDQRDSNLRKVKDYQKTADGYQNEAEKHRQTLNQLELKLREVLAGLPSTIVVPPPAIGIEDQVGREG